jgi:hypothetical protein
LRQTLFVERDAVGGALLLCGNKAGEEHDNDGRRRKVCTFHDENLRQVRRTGIP